MIKASDTRDDAGWDVCDGHNNRARAYVLTSAPVALPGIVIGLGYLWIAVGSPLYGTLAENLSGVRAVQSMSREGENSRRFDQLNRENRNAAIWAGMLSAAVLPVVEVAVAIATTGVIIVGGLRALNICERAPLPHVGRDDVEYAIVTEQRVARKIKSFDLKRGTAR